MKIKACQIKPGMVIRMTRKWKKRNIEDISLVTATEGKVKVKYTHLDFQDAYFGLLAGTLDGETEVNVIVGKKREQVIDKIFREVIQNLSDIQNVIDTIRLIKAMERK